MPVPIPHEWGIATEERSLMFPCDDLFERSEKPWYRGVTVRAPPEVVFRWLCQMKVASYSYGRKSPQTLSPGLEELAVGQRLMRSFDLVDFERPRHLTIRLRPDALESRFVRDIAVSYLIVPDDSDSCRLLVKLLVRHREGLRGWLVRLLGPWGDLMMMRRQLLNFKRLSEKTSESGD